MLTYIIWAIVAYFLYRFIFGFIVPLVITTRKFRRQVRDFQSNMQQQHEGFDNSYHSSASSRDTFQDHPSKPTSKTKKEGDYIDFEEIK